MSSVLLPVVLAAVAGYTLVSRLRARRRSSRLRTWSGGRKALALNIVARD